MIGSIRKLIDGIEVLLDSGKSDNEIIELQKTYPQLEKEFDYITGITIKQYVRNRRLYLAAIDIKQNDEKMISIANRYGYKELDSFNKAFNRFHGFAPSELRKNKNSIIRIFLKFEIDITIIGGELPMPEIVNDTIFAIKGYKMTFNNNFTDDAYFKNIIRTEEKIRRVEAGLHRQRRLGIAFNKDNGIIQYIYGIDEADVAKGTKLRSYRVEAKIWAKYSTIIGSKKEFFPFYNDIFRHWFNSNDRFVPIPSFFVEEFNVLDDYSVEYTLWIPVEINTDS